MGRGNWPEFRDWAASADHNDVLTCLYSVEQRDGVVGKFLNADVAHSTIISVFGVFGKRQNKALQQTHKSILPALIWRRSTSWASS